MFKRVARRLYHVVSPRVEYMHVVYFVSGAGILHEYHGLIAGTLAIATTIVIIGSRGE